MTTHGIHHVTAVTAKANENLKFYTEVLGLRLVKKTVNQDDTSAYHLFYADKLGSPGTDMTFFDWEKAGPKQSGSDNISRTLFRINPGATTFWSQRLNDAGFEHSGVVTWGEARALLFEDAERQSLGLVEDGGAAMEGEPWGTVEIKTEQAIKGFYAVQLTVPKFELVEPILTKALGWESLGDIEANGTSLRRFAMAGGGPGKEVHVLEKMAAPLYASTAGSVHHVAFRVSDDQALNGWMAHIDRLGLPNSGIVDRFYFKSLYFRISRGILFEFATEGPGFATDEDPEHLGEKLSLPPFLESQRAQIESQLKPL